MRNVPYFSWNAAFLRNIIFQIRNRHLLIYSVPQISVNVWGSSKMMVKFGQNCVKKMCNVPKIRHLDKL